VAARIPVVEEVLGDCPAYAEPGDVESFAAAFKSVLDAVPADRIERGRTRARAFTWSSVAQRMMGVYRSLV